VDERVVNPGGAVAPVVVALPVPAGVDAAAVGAQVPSAPEPHEWLLMAVAVAFMALASGGARPSSGLGAAGRA
jgi:Ca-activated chloride channel family protein